MNKRKEAQKAYHKAITLAEETYDKAREEKEENERTNTSVSNP